MRLESERWGLCVTLLLLMGMTFAVHAQAAPADSALPEIVSAEQARAEFDAVCLRLTDSDEMYHGRKMLLQAERLLASGIYSGAERIQIEIKLGQELLKQGRASEAIELLSGARKQAQGMMATHGSLWAEATHNLAVAHLRAAEDQNCVLHHTAASCIFPIAEEGVHQRPEHARRAGDLLAELVGKLNPSPRTMQMGWLLNLSRTVAGASPEEIPQKFRLPSSTFQSDQTFPAWTDRAIPLGVGAVDLAGGAVMDDFDGDGLLDLVTSTSDPCGSMTAFRNRGDGEFEDVTVAWGLDSQLGGLNLTHADYDGDGKLDLLLLRGGWLGHHGNIRNSLLRNELGSARGRFVDVSISSGLGRTASPSQTAAWADYDGDGDLDVYVGNESDTGNAHPSRLYRNEGDGTFAEVGVSAGVDNERFAKAVTWGDYDNDGDPDLFVSNVGANRLYQNKGDGTFADVAKSAGVSEPSGRSFADWFFDYDNDGDLDLFVADYSSAPALIAVSYYGLDVPSGQPLLYRNDKGIFTEISRQSGLVRPALPMGANYGDLDNDGWLDFYLGTGDPRYETVFPNLMYRNQQGVRFADVTVAGGFGHLQKGHGVAFGDLDNDGDQDLFHQVGGFYPGDAFANALFENPGNDAGWITLRLEGRKANRFGVGARIEIRVREKAIAGKEPRLRSIHRVAGSGGSFGGSSMQQEIGLGQVDRIEEIVVRWPGSATVQHFRNVRPNRVYDVVEGRDRLAVVKLPRFSLSAQ